MLFLTLAECTLRRAVLGLPLLRELLDKILSRGG